MLMIAGNSTNDRRSNAGSGPDRQPGSARAWLWPVGVVVLLLGSISICVATAVIAASDRTFALEPEYYAQAVAWDQTAQQREASRALGWSVAAEVSSRDSAGERTLSVRITDAAGQPVAADRVEVIAFHHARSRERVTLGVGTGAPAPAAGRGAITDAAPGIWAWSLGTARAGVWQVRLRAARGQDVFVTRLDIESPDGGR